MIYAMHAIHAMIYAMIQAIIQAMHAQVLAQLRKDLKPRYRQHSSACLYGFEPIGKQFHTIFEGRKWSIGKK